MPSADRARVTTFVAVSPLDAFEVFTQETDVWWSKGPRNRAFHASNSSLRFEPPGPGGRLLESSETEVFEVGRVLVWEPGARLVFQWRASNFAPDEITEVEVRFEPSFGGTRVVLEHRGWDSIRMDHPARHGMDGPATVGMMGRWWGDLVTRFRLRAGRPLPA
ncbi:activator of HSP90 ATPase [Corallococcus praedator]|uniref:Activator of HSP90 ATPase n=2 Tax=Myxococcaceae TaxID=31 RepID=A0ABX9QJ44_9BACT|nr:activator of HSP90 ATPase [Corallococcus sp. CA047B]RKH31615.1 activator of HSP90 ATPase [Corallococcus sp. CA031C]RKI09509.1 activator of HSP90 ATPase [Corallococcus praedator]